MSIDRAESRHRSDPESGDVELEDVELEEDEEVEEEGLSTAV